jgi:hypothetical protein
MLHPAMWLSSRRQNTKDECVTITDSWSFILHFQILKYKLFNVISFFMHLSFICKYEMISLYPNEDPGKWTHRLIEYSCHLQHSRRSLSFFVHKGTQILLKCEILAVLNIKLVVLWYVTPCILIHCVYHTMQLQFPEYGESDDDNNSIVIGNE